MSSRGFSVDASDFEKAARALESEGFERQAGRTTAYAIRRMVNIVRNAARRELGPHRRTGKMRDRIRARIRGAGLDAVAGVKSTGAGSNLIVGGVVPHPIAPGRVMPMWEGRGAFRGGSGSGITGFATAVQHPGFAPDPFFFRAVRSSQGEFSAIIQKATQTMVKELAYRMHTGRS